MRRRAFGLLLLALAGCHNPADDLAKLDVANPAVASGWLQFRHGPGGYAFQAPKGWMLDPQDDAQRLMARTGSDLNLFLRLVDAEAARKGDLVSFGVTRLAFGGDDDIDKLDNLKVIRLDEFGDKALKGMRMNAPDAKRERIALPIGPAEHVWAVMDKPMADGSKVRMTSHLVVFATALRPFVLMYGYPTAKEAEYRPTLDAIVKTVRLFHPEKAGKVEVPPSAFVLGTTYAPAPNAAPPTARTRFGGGSPTGMGAGGFGNMPPTAPTPSDPVPSNPVPSNPAPSDPLPANPLPPADPGAGPSEPPANDPGTIPSGTGDPGAAPPPPGP